MNNLEKYNLQEICENELKEISGGRWWNPVFFSNLHH